MHMYIVVFLDVSGWMESNVVFEDAWSLITGGL